MSECRDQRLVAIDELRPGLGNSSAIDGCLLIVSFDEVRDRVRIVEQRRIRLSRRKIAMLFESLQSYFGFTDIAIRQRAEGPDECQVGIYPQSALEIVQSGVEVLIKKGTDVAINSQRLGIFRVKPDRVERVFLRKGK